VLLSNNSFVQKIVKAMKTIFNFARGRSVTLFLATLMLFYGTGCQTLFKLQTIQPQRINSLNEFGAKRFIVHTDRYLYELVSPTVKNGQLTGVLTSPGQTVHYFVDRDKRYTKEEESILNEVHIFLSEKSLELPYGQSVISVQNIAQIQVIKKSQTGKNIVIGVSVTALLLLIGIASFVGALSSP